MNKYMYALLIGFVALNIYPPRFIVAYTKRVKPDLDIGHINSAVSVLMGAPDMLNNMVRAMTLDMIDRGVK
jgi:hypothetical protein